MINKRNRLVFLIIGVCICTLALFGCSRAEVQEDTNVAAVDKKVATIENKKESVDLSKINPDGKTPNMKFEEISHDFGKQMSGPELKHTFNFRNEGDGTLFIEKVKAG